MLKTITCADCSRKRKTRYKNTKYCLVCRLIRNLKFIGESTSECLACGKTFAPLKRGDYMCGKCDDVPAAGNPQGTCGLCKAEDVPIVNEDVSVCHPCSTDPEKRKLLIVALVQKRKKAQAET